MVKFCKHLINPCVCVKHISGCNVACKICPGLYSDILRINNLFPVLKCTVFNLLLKILLLLCNDIEQNPGPLCNLNISHLNVRSLRNKLDIIDNELSENDILCLTETHLHLLISDNDLVLDSFHDLYRRDRQLGFGGGIVVYTIVQKHSYQ